MAWVTLVIVLALVEFMYFGALVGRARHTYDVPAPRTSGHPTFERYNRVHQNTMEQLVVFIPALWLFAQYMSPMVGALLGLVFIASRALYAVSYVKDPKTRRAGIMSTGVVLLVLLAGAVFGAAKALLT
jgi:glutathione S-transferase